MSQIPQAAEPLACTLSETAQAERRAVLADTVFARVEAVQELPEGYAFRFPATGPMLAELSDFVLFERDCCVFTGARASSSSSSCSSRNWAAPCPT